MKKSGTSRIIPLTYRNAFSCLCGFNPTTPILCKPLQTGMVLAPMATVQDTPLNDHLHDQGISHLPIQAMALAHHRPPVRCLATQHCPPHAPSSHAVLTPKNLAQSFHQEPTFQTTYIVILKGESFSPGDIITLFETHPLLSHLLSACVHLQDYDFLWLSEYILAW